MTREMSFFADIKPFSLTRTDCVQSNLGTQSIKINEEENFRHDEKLANQVYPEWI